MLDSQRHLISHPTGFVAGTLAAMVLLTACTGTASSPSNMGAPAPPAAGSGSPAASVSPVGSKSSASGNPTVSINAAAANPVTGMGATPTAREQVNANTASQDDVARVLTVNGVPNAGRWAREVVEYRPYPTDDPSFAKLRQELAKYNPGPQVTEQIIAALTL